MNESQKYNSKSRYSLDIDYLDNSSQTSSKTNKNSKPHAQHKNNNPTPKTLPSISTLRDNLLKQSQEKGITPTFTEQIKTIARKRTVTHKTQPQIVKNYVESTTSVVDSDDSETFLQKQKREKQKRDREKLVAAQNQSKMEKLKLNQNLDSHLNKNAVESQNNLKERFYNLDV